MNSEKKMPAWQVPYPQEPFDFKLHLLLLAKKWWVLLVSSILGVLLVGGPYFLKHVVYAPAREYEMVSDIFVEYAENTAGEEYTYFNQTTWYQLLQDDVFIDKVMMNILADDTVQVAENGNGVEPITKEMLKSSIQGTLLSDTRIVTTTVRTHSPEQTKLVNDALLQAFEQFAKERKEIKRVEVLNQPQEATLVVRDVRLFRACMLGLVLFDFVTLLVMLCRAVLDDSIYKTYTFEKRYQVPMIGWIKKARQEDQNQDTYQYSKEITVLAEQYLSKDTVVVTMDEGISADEVKVALADKGIPVGESVVIGDKDITEAEAETIRKASEILLVVKAANHNGKAIEEVLSLGSKLGKEVTAGVLIC